MRSLSHDHARILSPPEIQRSKDRSESVYRRQPGATHRT